MMLVVGWERGELFNLLGCCEARSVEVLELFI